MPKKREAVELRADEIITSRATTFRRLLNDPLAGAVEMCQRRAETSERSSAYKSTHEIPYRGNENHPVDEVAMPKKNEGYRADKQAHVDCDQDPISALLSSDVVHGCSRSLGPLTPS